MYRQLPPFNFCCTAARRACRVGTLAGDEQRRLRAGLRDSQLARSAESHADRPAANHLVCAVADHLSGCAVAWIRPPTGTPVFKPAVFSPVVVDLYTAGSADICLVQRRARSA